MSKTTNQHTVLYDPIVYRKNREKMNGHKSVVIWFTGLSGSGKSTLVYALESILHKNKNRAFVLDGDNIRQGLCKDLGFSDNDRIENIRRIGEVSKLMMDAGSIVLTAFISPFKNDRKVAREVVGNKDFIEVYCDCPLEICESRDVKGLYKKARKGEIPEFTGISSRYEKPNDPELVLDTNELSVNDCLNFLLHYILERKIITSIRAGSFTDSESYNRVLEKLELNNKLKQ